MKKTIIPLFAAAALAACGDSYYYQDAQHLRAQGLFLAAASRYKLFAEKNPSDPRAPQALFEAAGIYSKEFGLCSESSPLLERLLRNYPGVSFRNEALGALLRCPDYFPVNTAGVWVYGDSQTGGRSARQRFAILEVSSGKSRAENSIYAGSRLVIKQKRGYAFSGADVIESLGGFDTIILRYPLRAGLAWTSRDRSGRLSFRVEAAGLKIRTRAGEFGNCVKVRRSMAGMPSWVYEYYAPWTGRVLTSVAGPGFENRVMELISYEKKAN